MTTGVDSAERYVCPRCGKSFASPGRCSEHPDEDLLDTSDRQVQFFLSGLDDRHRMRVTSLSAVAGIVLGIGLGILFAVAGRGSSDDTSTLKVILLGMAAGVVISALVGRFFYRPKFTQIARTLETVGHQAQPVGEPEPVPAQTVKPEGAPAGNLAAATLRTRFADYRAKKGSRSKRFAFLIVTLVIFAALSAMSGSFRFVGILIGVLLLHEAGHALGMKWFGYQDVSIFFIPLFGAAASGRKDDASAWQKAVVSLMGPLPGILLGFGLLIANFSLWAEPLISTIGVYLVVINLFNLLPFMPFDGGHFFNQILFARHRALELAFAVVSTAGLFLLGYLLGSTIFYIMGGLSFIWLPNTVKVRSIIQAIRSRSERDPSEADDETLLAIDEAIAKRFPSLGADQRLPMIQRVLSGLVHKKVGFPATVGLLSLYMLPIVLGGASVWWLAKEDQLPQLLSRSSEEPQGDTWKQIAPAADGFRVSFPGEPIVSETVDLNALGTMKLKSYLMVLHGGRGALMVQHGEAPKEIGGTDEILALLQKDDEASERAPDKRNFSSRNIETRGHPGRELSFEFVDADEPAIVMVGRARRYVVDRHVYWISVIRLKGSDTDDIQDRFFDSFGLAGRTGHQEADR